MADYVIFATISQIINPDFARQNRRARRAAQKNPEEIFLFWRGNPDILPHDSICNLRIDVKPGFTKGTDEFYY